MKRPKLIVLLTDFGLRDPYVGIMKGVISMVNPRLNVVDLSHDVPPQDIRTASFILASSVSHFPKDTVFVVVVDPGVGSERKAIAVKTSRGFFVGPDNGVFSGVLSEASPKQVVELTEKRFWHLRTPSKTFHGRDIFAPCGAHLANGTNFQKLGTHLEPTALNCIIGDQPTEEDGGLNGVIQAVDHFGNLITTFPADLVTGKSWVLRIGGIDFCSASTYADMLSESPVSLIGSHGFVELALRNGNAAAKMALKPGDQVTLRFPEAPGED